MARLTVTIKHCNYDYNYFSISYDFTLLLAYLDSSWSWGLRKGLPRSVQGGRCRGGDTTGIRRSSFLDGAQCRMGGVVVVALQGSEGPLFWMVGKGERLPVLKRYAGMGALQQQKIEVLEFYATVGAHVDSLKIRTRLFSYISIIFPPRF